MNRIALIRSDEGDWVELWCNDQLFHEGHSVPDDVWVEIILMGLGVEVRQTEVMGEEHEWRVLK